MKTSSRVILGAVIGALVLTLIWQQISLRRLRDENVGLRQQLDQCAQLAADNERLSNALAQAQGTLTDGQKRELLRLRGEVGSLRRLTNELAKAQEENRRLRETRPPAPAPAANLSPDEQAAMEQRQVAMAKLRDAKTLMLGFIMHAEDHQMLIPTNIAQVTPYFGKGESPLTGTNDFEVVFQGRLDSLTNAASTIVVRERQAWQGFDGRWLKAYGFADGHAELHTEPDGNFERWEKIHSPAAPPGP